MNLKIKKRVISMLCATVMGASSMGASVGAINTVPNCTQKSKDAVSKLNQTLECSTAGLTKLKDNIQKLKLKLNNQHDDAVENIIAELSWVIKKINNWGGYYIADENLVVEIQNEITNLNNQIIDLNNQIIDLNNQIIDLNNQITKLNSKCLSEELNLVIQNSTAICNKIETINNQLLEENSKSLFKKELNDKYTEHCKEVEGFHIWKDRYNISEGLDTIYENIRCVEEYYKSTREKADADVVEKFSELATNVHKEINEFRICKLSFLRKLDNTFTEYCKQFGKFRKWRADNYISKTSDPTIENRLNVVRYYSSNRKNADAGVVEEFFKLAKKSYEEMKEFKNRKTLFWRELYDKYKEYYSKVKEFLRWKDSNNISQGLDTIHDNISYLKTYCIALMPDANAVVINQFSELATKLCKEMEQFKSRKAFFWKELDDKYKEYRRRVEEFCTWNVRNNIIYTIHGIRARAIYDKISYFEKYYRFIRPNANAAVVNKISELETTLCKDMEEFRNRTLARQIFIRNVRDMFIEKSDLIWLI